MSEAAGTLTVMTPEGVELHLHPAGLYIRMVAALLDYMLVSGGQLFLYALLPPVRALQQPVLVVGAFVIPLLYHLLWEWYGHGQTPGKRWLGLRVVDATAGTLQFSQVLLRNLLRLIDILPLFYLVGGVCGWLHQHGRRLGDLAAHTVVVRRSYGREEHQLAARPHSTDNVFLNQPRLVQRLRRALTPAQAMGLQVLLLQRETLRPEVRLQLCAEAAEALAVAAGLPSAWLQTIPPEQLLHSALQALASGSSPPPPTLAVGGSAGGGDSAIS